MRLILWTGIGMWTLWDRIRSFGFIGVIMLRWIRIGSFPSRCFTKNGIRMSRRMIPFCIVCCFLLVCWSWFCRRRWNKFPSRPVCSPQVFSPQFVLYCCPLAFCFSVLLILFYLFPLWYLVVNIFLFCWVFVCPWLLDLDFHVNGKFSVA